MVRRFLTQGGSDFQIHDPENARLTLYRPMWGRGRIKLFEPYLLIDLMKSEREYSRVSTPPTLNIITIYLFICILVVSVTGEV